MNVDDAMEAAKNYLANEQEGEPLFEAEEVAITLAAEVERLRAELAEKKTENDRLKVELAQSRKDWCDDDEAIKQ